MGMEMSNARRRRQIRRRRSQERAWEALAGPRTVRRAADPLFDRLRALTAICVSCAQMAGPGLSCEMCECQATETGMVNDTPSGSLDDAVHVHLCRTCTVLVAAQVPGAWVHGE